MPPLNVMFKTVSSDCNLDCSYCYYRVSLEGERPRRRLDIALLERFLPQYMEYVADTHQANLSWQGGEPTLAGLDFFRQVAAMEAKYARPPMIINNSLQTNGLLINDEWAELFSTYSFLVGVSLDGPEEIHDAMRKDRGGHGSFRRVMAGIDVLRKHDVSINILCVVGPHNVGKARELAGFFRREGLDYLQFMPAMDFQSTEPAKPPAYLVSAPQYGEFLKALFYEWYGDGLPTTSIRVFDNFLQSVLGMGNSLCVHSDRCDSGIIVECDGSVFPCDFYVSPEWQLGNVNSNSVKEIAEGEKLRQFMARKSPLPAQCSDCRWKALCKGECPRTWPVPEGGKRGPSYFCQSYQMLFEHSYDRIAVLARRLRKYGKYVQWLIGHGGKIPRQIAPCPCGSRAKFRDCCGDPRLGSSYLFQV